MIEKKNSPILMGNPLCKFWLKNAEGVLGHGVVTSLLRLCLGPGPYFAAFLVRSASFSSQTTKIMSGSSHARPTDVTTGPFS